MTLAELTFGADPMGITARRDQKRRTDALVSVAQTLLRVRGVEDPTFVDVSTTVEEVNRGLSIGGSESDAIIELSRRYALY